MHYKRGSHGRSVTYEGGRYFPQAGEQERYIYEYFITPMAQNEGNV